MRNKVSNSYIDRYYNWWPFDDDLKYEYTWCIMIEVGWYDLHWIEDNIHVE